MPFVPYLRISSIEFSQQQRCNFVRSSKEAPTRPENNIDVKSAPKIFVGSYLLKANVPTMANHHQYGLVHSDYFDFIIWDY